MGKSPYSKEAREAREVGLAEMRQRWRGKPNDSASRKLALLRGRKAVAARRKRAKVVAMYQAGASGADIAEALDMTPASVYMQLRRAGVQSRSYSEAVTLAWGQRDKFLSIKKGAPPSKSEAITGKQAGCEWGWCGVKKLCSDCAESAAPAPH